MFHVDILSRCYHIHMLHIVSFCRIFWEYVDFVFQSQCLLTFDLFFPSTAESPSVCSETAVSYWNILKTVHSEVEEKVCFAVVGNTNLIKCGAHVLTQCRLNE